MMELAAFVFLALIIASDMTYSAITGAAHLIRWPHALLTELAVFVAAGRRIAQLDFGLLRGLTINQQVATVEADVGTLERLSEDGGSEELEMLLAGTTGQSWRVRGQLVTSRLALRALLMRLCRAHGISLRPAPSIFDMLRSLRESQKIA